MEIEKSAELELGIGIGILPGRPRRGKKAELVACPWCKRAVSVYNYRLGTDIVGDWWVECENPVCPVNPSSKHYKTKEELIEHWNSYKRKMKGSVEHGNETM